MTPVLSPQKIPTKPDDDGRILFGNVLFLGGDENDALTTPLPKGRGFTLDLGKHLSVPVELGVAFQGSQQASLALAGSVCDSTGFNCPPITSVPANIVSEQAKISRGMWFFKAYPIVSVEFGYKF